jgi:amino-acid N-acetyltransferase
MCAAESTTDAKIRVATSADRLAIERLLEANDMPVAGIPQALEGFFVAESDGEIVGVIGVEQWGDDGLLRSAAVESRARGVGLGRRLVDHAVVFAEGRALRRLYLLTTTAEHYFPAFGFSRVERDAVPAEIQQSVEFRGACPASAVAMMRTARSSPMDHQRRGRPA